MAANADTSLTAAQKSKLNNMLNNFQTPDRSGEECLPNPDEVTLQFQGHKYQGFDMVTYEAWKQVIDQVENERDARKRYQSLMPKLERDFSEIEKSAHTLLPLGQTVESSLKKLSIDADSDRSNQLADMIQKALDMRPGFASLLAERGLIEGASTKSEIEAAHKMVCQHNECLDKIRPELDAVKHGLVQANKDGNWEYRLSQVEQGAAKVLHQYLDTRKKWSASKTLLETSLTTARNQNTQLRTQVTNFNAVSQQLAQQGTDLTTAHEEQAILQGEVTELRAILDCRDASIQEKDDRISSLRADLKTSQSTADQHRRSSEGYRTQNGTLQTRLSESKATATSLSNQLVQVNDSLQECVRARDNFRTSSDHETMQRHIAERRLRRNFMRMGVLSFQLAGKQHQLDRTATQAAQSAQTLQQQISGNNRLQDSVQRLSEEVARLGEELASSQGANTALNARIQGYESQLQSAQTAGNALSRRITVLRGLLLREQQAHAERRLTDVSLRSRNSLESSIGEYESALSEAVSTNEDLQQRASDLRDGVSDKDILFTQAQADIQALRLRVGQFEQQRLNDQSSMETAQKATRALQQQVETLQQELAGAKTSLNVAQKTNCSLNEQVGSLKDEASATSTSLGLAQEVNINLQEKVQSLEQSLSEGKVSLEKASADNEQLRGENEVQEAELSQRTGRVTELTEELSALNTSLSQLERKSRT